MSLVDTLETFAFVPHSYELRLIQLHSNTTWAAPPCLAALNSKFQIPTTQVGIPREILTSLPCGPK